MNKFIEPDTITPRVLEAVAMVEGVVEKAAETYQHAGPIELAKWYKSLTDHTP